MTNHPNRRAGKKSALRKAVSASSNSKEKPKHKLSTYRIFLFSFVVLVVAVACIFYVSLENKAKLPKQKQDNDAAASNKQESVQNENKKQTKRSKHQSKGHLPPETKNFKHSIQKQLYMSSSKQIRELKLSPHNSSVRVYVIEDFLTDYECDGLMRVHNKHLSILNQNDPILCFDSVTTLRKNLKELNLKYKVSSKDFTHGTTCLNESFSGKLKAYFKWSYSTAFYPGENKFSTIYAQRIKEATGLKLENGGKFQVTSYPVGVGYKSHTDCVVYEKGEGEQRDRIATILVYLQDVEKGGETEFTLLGVKVKPKKGLALVWNSMDEQGNCERLSLHDAKRVIKGHKYIIQRWYYYRNFPALGKRPPEPSLPKRRQDQPRVSCDEYEQGSCRWYDEWNYDHIIEYTANSRNLL